MDYRKKPLHKYPKNIGVATTTTPYSNAEVPFFQDISYIKDKIVELLELVSKQSSKVIDSDYIYTQDDFNNELFKQLKIETDKHINKEVLKLKAEIGSLKDVIKTLEHTITMKDKIIKSLNT